MAYPYLAKAKFPFRLETVVSANSAKSAEDKVSEILQYSDDWRSYLSNISDLKIMAFLLQSSYYQVLVTGLYEVSRVVDVSDRPLSCEDIPFRDLEISSIPAPRNLFN